ncbi:MAG: ATP-dependent DNA helicase RecG [Bacilli bacterium]
MNELMMIKGVGQKSAKALENMGIFTKNDLIKNYPYKFIVLKKRSLDDDAFYNEMVIDGVVESTPVIGFFKGGNRLSFRLNTQNRTIVITIFNRSYIKNNIKVGSIITVIGKYDKYKQSLVANNIMFMALPNKELIIPVYHLTSKLTSKQINLFINNSLNENVESIIPKKIENKYNFMDVNMALKTIHNPDDIKKLKEALKRLKYEELYEYMYKLYVMKQKRYDHNVLYVKKIDSNIINNFINTLPYKLTVDQKAVIKELLNDLNSDIKMNRLLQGDVGSGKTIVALIGAYALYTAGFQSAFMVPTEVLAAQHYRNALEIFSNTKLKVALLTGKMTLKEKEGVYKALENGQIDLLIGTHALISDKVTWHNLGFVITDEQHRFGVNQRLTLKNKSMYPETLLMSATPIPRTYALTIYGDTDVSSIKTMPKGRVPIKTYVKKTSELKEVLEAIYQSLKNNNQVYVVAPLIEESEKASYENVIDLKRKFEVAFKNYKIEVLHGKLSTLEKSRIMDDFASNKINILISTTVIEVGIDVRNATNIIVFDAHRFGLSTLHQLRGRVGRNNVQSYCYLISDKDNKRLKIMESTSDGYEISEADFKLRGQGDLFGIKQSGDNVFKLSDLKKDYDLLVKVKSDIETYFSNDIDNKL